MTSSDWTSQPARIVCLGLSAMDHIWRAERLPDGAIAKTRATDFSSRGGGMAATAAVAASRLGARTQFWGRGGDDPEGRMAREELGREGVGIDGYRLFPGTRSSVSGVFVGPDGERHIVNFRGSGLPDDASWLPLERLDGVCAVLCDPRWPDGAETVFRAAREKGIATILDGDVADKAVFERLLPLCDHAIFSLPGLKGFAGATDRTALDRVAAFGCRIVAVTRGEDGVDWIEDGAPCRQPSFQTDIVDTTGAGDVFHGAYARAIAGGAPIVDAFGFAAAAAALKCRKPGGREGIAGMNETVQFWRMT